MHIDIILDSAGVSDTNLDGRTVLVTGSTSGIGRYAAEGFAELGANVIIHGRNEKAGEEIVNKIQNNGGTAQFIECDFSEVSSVQSFVTDVQDTVDRLDILVNNAGGFFTHTQPQDEEINYTFMVNHLASFIVTTELLPLLRSEESLGRIVNTSSSAHESATYNPDQFTKNTNSWNAYCQSKLLNLIFAKYLSRTEPTIRSVAIHPGVIPGSGFARNLPSFIKPLGSILSRIPLVPIKKPQSGSVPILYGAIHPNVKSGTYITQTKEIPAKPEVDTTKIQEDLYEKSQSMYEQHD